MQRFAFFLLLIATARGEAVAGAWERFDSEAGTDTWALYSYADELTAPPLWAGPDEDENPYAWSYFLGGQGLWFFADELTADSMLIGDFATQKIAGIDVSVSVDPAQLDFLDLAVYADGPNGPDYYYSRIYQPDDLGTEADWYAIGFPFDESWFSLEGDDFVPFEPDTQFLSSVGEVGLRVFPADGIGEEGFVGIDDFILVPTDEAPELATSVLDDTFSLTFTPNPGLAATIERLTGSNTWQAVDGQSDLTGPQKFTTPVTPSPGLFRVKTVEDLTPVATP